MKMTLKTQYERFKQNLIRKVQEAGLILEGEMHNLVAIDTGKLDQSITTDNAVDRGNIVSVDVGSQGVPYAVFVDQGIKNEVFNYHRRQGASRPVVWVGVGQQYMERSLENKAGEISLKIREAKVS